jgi:hypothetical protein
MSKKELKKNYIDINPYHNGWKLIALHPGSKPKGVKQWLNFIWGFDIFIYKIPFMKILILANIIIWWLF